MLLCTGQLLVHPVPCCPFSFRVLFSLHYVNGINKVMMMMITCQTAAPIYYHATIHVRAAQENNVLLNLCIFSKSNLCRM